uniref:C2H2-type domain-containing protein n=1 Tax=Ditylenchus dipsaci TaxID=166011 RepID=A0A915EJP5_9BILA
MNEQPGGSAMDAQLFQEVYLRAYIQEQQRIVQLKQQQQQQSVHKPFEASIAKPVPVLPTTSMYNHPQSVFQLPKPRPTTLPQSLQYCQQHAIVQQAKNAAQISSPHHLYQLQQTNNVGKEEQVKQQQYLHQQLLHQQQLHFEQQQILANQYRPGWPGDVNNNNNTPTLLGDQQQQYNKPSVSYALGNGYSLCVSSNADPPTSSQGHRKCSSSSAPSPSAKRFKWEPQEEVGISVQGSSSVPPSTTISSVTTEQQQLSCLQALVKKLQEQQQQEKLTTTIISPPAVVAAKGEQREEDDDVENEKLTNIQSTAFGVEHSTAASANDSTDTLVANVCSVQAAASSMYPAGNSVDDTEEENFVDVVGGVDGVPSFTRAQRKAHIEFYRKIKAFRNRETTLECQMCQEKVANTESNIRSHVHSHSDSPLYVCKMCIKGYKEQHLIFEHISEAHPGKDHQFFEDRRDMSMLTELLMSCFPRCGPKCRSTYIQMLDQLLKLASQLDRLACQLCSKEVPCKRSSLIKHLHLHPSYRCKKCKFTSSEEFELLKHCQTEHSEATEGVVDSSPGYNVSMALEVLSSTLKKCFFGHYCGLLEGATVSK